MLSKLEGCGQVSNISVDYDCGVGLVRADILAGEFSGSVANLPDDIYHSLPYVSSSQLKYLHKTSPAHFKAKFIDKTIRPEEPSYAMKLGTAVHSMILTPDLFKKNIYIAQKIDARTKEGKEAKLQMERESFDKTVIYEADLPALIGMDASVKRNKPAQSVMDETLKELSLFWKCPGTGLMMKARIDAVNTEYLIELKTTKSAQPKMFESTAFNLNYDLSLAHYLEGCRNVLHTKPNSYFVVVESEAPYVSQTFLATDDFISVGHAKWLDAIMLLSRCYETKTWPGYSDENVEPILMLNPPKWAGKREVEEDGI